MVVCVCLHIIFPHDHHYADLSEGIEYLKCFSGTLCLACLSKIKFNLSIIYHSGYGAVCIQLTHFFYGDLGNTCTCYYRHQIGSMTCLPLFMVISWDNDMHCMPFYILILMIFNSKGAINNTPALLKVLAWHRTGKQPLCEITTISVLIGNLCHSTSFG